MRAVETVAIPGTLPGVGQAIDACDRFGRSHGVPSRAAWRLLLALDEILSNIVRHGGGGSADIDVTFSVEDGAVSVDVVDSGAAFNPLLAPAPDTTSLLERRPAGGLGIALVRQLMDDTQYERRNERNHFRMTIDVHGHR